MMTLYEFNLLEQEKQFDTVFTIGDFIEHHLTENKRYSLYGIGMFYVEVIYNPKTNKITGLKTFKNSSKRLEKYFGKFPNSHFNK